MRFFVQKNSNNDKTPSGNFPMYTSHVSQCTEKLDEKI